MRGHNEVTLIGNIGQDPVVKVADSGDKYAQFSLATGEAWRDRETQELRETTEWHSVIAWRKTAEIVEQYCKKGARIFVQGKIKTHTYEKDGETRRYTQIVAEKILLLDTNGGSLGQTDADNALKSQEQRDFEDTIPF